MKGFFGGAGEIHSGSGGDGGSPDVNKHTYESEVKFYFFVCGCVRRFGCAVQ